MVDTEMILSVDGRFVNNLISTFSCLSVKKWKFKIASVETSAKIFFNYIALLLLPDLSILKRSIHMSVRP